MCAVQDYGEQEEAVKYNVPSTQRHEARTPSGKGIRGCTGLVAALDDEGVLCYRLCGLERGHEGEHRAEA